MKRTSFAEQEWRGRPVQELGHSELLELVEVLFGMVLNSAENFERILAEKFPRHTVAGNA